jgi:hypothetical protein
MQVLDSLTIRQGGRTKTIELCHGDLTELGPDEAVDVLVISAFLDDYSPVPSTLIGALDRKGIMVWALAGRKAWDLRPTHSCWLTEELHHRPPGIEYRRILCFEPALRGEPPEVVGDIFRSLAPLLTETPPVRSVAMPLVAAGSQGESPSTMFKALMDAALHWMSLDFPLERLKIAVYGEAVAWELKQNFLPLKQKFFVPNLTAPEQHRFDVFVSYSRRNADKARVVVDEMRRLRPTLCLFYDQMTLRAGTAWQQDIYDAVESSAAFVALYSPDYLQSKVCLEEFHLAKFCNREAGLAALLPLYVYSASLPAYMKMLNYIDCREGDDAKLRRGCADVVAALEGLS